MSLNKEKKLLKNFNSNKCIENWRILEEHIDDKSMCQDCGDSVYYSNSMMRVSREGVLRYDSNFPCCRSFKIIEDKKYFLKSCPLCLEKKFDEYTSMNKSRIFNVMNRITIYSFGVPEDVAKRFTKTTAVTLNNLVNKYGQKEGNERWKKYCALQSVTNTFEYKKRKYGWNRKEFDSFNKSRAVTIGNMIKKYGIDEGTLVFNDYVNKQRTNGKSIEWFTGKHGEIEGRIRHKEMLIGKAKGGGVSGVSCSKVSQEFIEKIDSYFKDTHETYYHTKNHEKIVYIDSISKCYILDYYINDLNVCIEFNGDYYHANPNKFSYDFEFPEFSNSVFILKAKDIWEKDKRKIESLSEIGIKTIVVWESDYYKNKNNEEFYKNIVDLCLKKS